MDGKQLFALITSKRDHTGGEEDMYAELICTIFLHIKYDLYPLLEQAHRESKKLALKDEFVDEIVLSDVILV